MFDTHIHRRAPAYPQSVHATAHEHRAPTDESVRLLREMEDKARDSVIHAIRCDANQFRFRSVVWDDHAAFCRKARIQFSLNERGIDFEIEMPSHAISLEETVDALKKAITERIAKELVINLAHEHFTKL